MGGTGGINTPTDEYAFWCPLCNEWRELEAATTPLAGGDPPTPANRCAECDGMLVLKKVETAE